MSRTVKRLIALVVCLAVYSSIIPASDISVNVKAAETYNTQTRSSDFNEGWEFALEPEGEPQTSDYDDSSWQDVTLPHDWSITQNFSNSISSGVGCLKGGNGWYRKHFTLPKELSGKRISIDFDGVYMDSYVYVNGNLVGNYPNGYVPFSFDITDYVTCDGQTDNVIAVSVTNTTNEKSAGYTSRWYSGSGIYRDVHLTVTDSVHVEKYGTFITTPDLESEYSSGKISTNVQTKIVNEGASAIDVQIRNTIMNYKGTRAFKGASPVLSGLVSVASGDAYEFFQVINATSPKLWTLDSPNLYKMKTEVIVNGNVVDTYETRFGYKWFEFDADKGFSLNGESMKLRGVCLHHDQGALGAVANVAAMKRQVKIMKDMGVNAIRTAHNAAAPEFIRICDEEGVMVFEESFDSWWDGKNTSDYGAKFFEAECTYPGVPDGTTWAKYDLQQIIKKDRNSPSIIMWGIGNECAETAQTKAIDFVNEIMDWVKEVDETHPATMGDNKFKVTWAQPSLPTMKKVDGSLDLVGLNYGEMYYDSLHEEFPDWIIFGSETTSTVSSRGYYSEPWISGDHAVDNVDGNLAADAVAGKQLSEYDNRTARFGRNVTEALIFDRDREFIAGQFVWTGFDYIGEPTPLDGAAKSSYFGIVDTAGFAKDRYYLYQSQWTDAEDNPMVHILPHWNWEDNALRKKVTYPEKSTLSKYDEVELVDYSDEDVGKIPMRVYSNAPSVELFVDGVSQGKKSFAVKTTSYGKKYQQQSEDSDRMYLEWPLEWSYNPGTTIEAVAYDDKGKEIARDRVVTADAPAKLALSADRSEIISDGKDLSYITVDVLDSDNNFVPTASDEISFSIEGCGEIVGVDNGDPVSRERYQYTDGNWKRSAFNGKALVIVRSTDTEGSFTVTAKADNLQECSITVNTSYEKPYVEEEEDIKPDDTKTPVVTETPAPANSNNTVNTSDTTTEIKTENKQSAAAVKSFVSKKLKYTVNNAKKKTLTLTGTTDKNIKKLTIPVKVRYKGVSYTINKISKNAFSKCKKLKTVNVKSLTIKNVGKNAFKLLKKKSVKIILPKKKKKKYQKMFFGV